MAPSDQDGETQNMTEARKQLIRDLFDTNPNLTMAQLSRMTGLSIGQLKLILMSN